MAENKTYGAYEEVSGVLGDHSESAEIEREFGITPEVKEDLNQYGIIFDAKNRRLSMYGFYERVHDGEGNERNGRINEIVFSKGEKIDSLYDMGDGRVNINLKGGYDFHRHIAVSRNPFKEQFFSEQTGKAGFTPEMLKTLFDFGISVSLWGDFDNRSVYLKTNNFVDQHWTVHSWYSFNAANQISSVRMTSPDTIELSYLERWQVQKVVLWRRRYDN